MKKGMLAPLPLLILFWTVALSGFAQEEPIIVQKDEFRLTLRFIGKNAEITVRGRTTGWVAVGFDPQNKMKGADLLIGYMKDGKAFARDDFGTAVFLHSDDTKIKGLANILSASGSEVEGFTTMTFLVARDSGDSKDAKLLKGSHKIILAAGRADDFSSKHMSRTTASILLP